MLTKYKAVADRDADNRFITLWISHFDEIRARVTAEKPRANGEMQGPRK